MGYRKKTLRRMPYITRRMARLLGDLESVERRWKNLMPELERLEHGAQANAAWFARGNAKAKAKT